MPKLENIHASFVSVAGKGVLIRGPSGAGKSELALRLIDQPGRGLGQSLIDSQLVADDQVQLFTRDGRLHGRAPDNLRGLLEIRGLGVVKLDVRVDCPLDLIVDVTGSGERMPDFASQKGDLAGFSLPLLYLPPLCPSGPARIRAALQLLQNPGQLHA